MADKSDFVVRVSMNDVAAHGRERAVVLAALRAELESESSDVIATTDGRRWYTGATERLASQLGLRKSAARDLVDGMVSDGVLLLVEVPSGRKSIKALGPAVA